MQSEVSIEVRTLMARFRSGDHEAAGALVNHLYPELRRLAAAKMRREAPGHTWTPTVLVNELYLELVKIRALRDATEDASERDAFLGLAAFIMRRLLIRHSRPLYRKAQKVEPGVLERESTGSGMAGPEALAELEDVLQRLQRVDPRLRAVVELHVFEGKTIEETSVVVGYSARTVQTQWSFAKRWLARELQD